MKIFIRESKISDNPEDYSDGHTAPGKDEPAMYDVSEYFPDMYNSNAYTVTKNIEKCLMFLGY